MTENTPSEICCESAMRRRRGGLWSIHGVWGSQGGHFGMRRVGISSDCFRDGCSPAGADRGSARCSELGAGAPTLRPGRAGRALQAGGLGRRAQVIEHGSGRG